MWSTPRWDNVSLLFLLSQWWKLWLALLMVPALIGTGCGRSAPPVGIPLATPAPQATPTVVAPSHHAIVSMPVDDSPEVAAPRFSASLDVGIGDPPVRLELPSIEADIDVVELGWHTVEAENGQRYAEWDVAEFAAGWHKNSVLPGQTGNVVMSGHNNIKGAVFRELDKLEEGDLAHVWAGGHRISYRVDKVMIVPEKFASPEQRAENNLWIGPFNDDRLTLVSCWPRDGNTHRVIVVAHEIDEGAAETAAQ
jgi:LPXTG-site transpeptidase (sortase) family protein